MGLKFRKSFAILFPGLVALMVTGGGCRRPAGTVNIDDVAPAAAELPKTLAEYRRLGLPWQASDLGTVKDDESNAAIYLKSAEDRLTVLIPGRLISNYGGPTPDVKRFRVNKSVWIYHDIDFQPVLSFARIAADQPRLDYAHHWDEPGGRTGMIVRHREIVLLFCYEAEEAAKKGDVAGAIQNLNNAQRLIQLVFDQQDLLVASLGGRLENRLCHAYQTCLFEFSREPQNLTRFAEGFQLKDIHVDLTRMLRGEMYVMISSIRRDNLSPAIIKLMGTQNFQFPTPEPSIVKDGIPESDAQRAYMDRTLQYWTEAYPKAIKAKSLAQAGVELDAVGHRFDKQYGDSLAYSRAMDGFQRASLLAIFDKVNAKIRAENLLLQALKYKTAKGNWPQQLSELESGVNPMTNKSYLLSSQQGGIAIYTLDDDDSVDELDILFFVLLPREDWLETHKTKHFVTSPTHESPDTIRETIAMCPPPKLNNPEFPF